MKKIEDFMLINAGLLLVALGIYLFKVPNDFAIGGVSGIAIIMTKLVTGVPVGLLMMAVNIILLGVGFFTLGRDFGTKTVYSSFALSGMVWVLEKIHPITKPLTGDTLLELVYAIVLPAIGSAIVFDRNASTGGTDIVAKILSQHTHINIGKTLLMGDFIITLTAGIVFGVRVGMYAMLGLAMKGFLIDIVIENIHISKHLEIISSKSGEIQHYILNVLHRGATIYKASGAFTNEEKEVISVVVGRKEAIKLRSFVHEIDSKAFITISNASEIIGKGFRNHGF